MSELVEAAVHYEVRGDVAILTIANPPVNALSERVRNGLAEGTQRALADPAVAAVVLAGEGGRFAGGADIREFGAPKQGALMPEIQNNIENAAKPVVAAMDGHALGGGLELALAAHYRIGTPRLAIGLPEVNLGLLPGGGGTQRMTRLVGPKLALDLILSGKQLSAEEAKAAGIIDEVVSGDLLDAAVDFAHGKARQGDPLPKVIERGDKLEVAHDIFGEAREANARKWNGRVAPFAIVDCVEAATRLSPAEGLAYERAAFQRCHDSPERAALIHLFFAERKASKIDGVGRDIRAKPVQTVGVVGAGTMGGGIAMAAANAGLKVLLLDVAQPALDAAAAKIGQLYDRSVARGSTSSAKAGAALANIRTTLDYADLGEADVLIEAALEDMAVKQRIFAQLDSVAKHGALLATNTSALDIDQVALATKRPGDVLGLHFFSPANVMKLLEVVRGASSSDEAIVTAMGFAKRLGKVPVLAGNSDGFIGNRILKVYSREAEYLLEEGATPAEVDGALQGFGFPMGVFLMRDMAGLDVAWQVRRNRLMAGLIDPSERYAPLADRLCERGRFGQKTGAGYYRYEDGKAIPDSEVETMLQQISREKGFARRPIGSDEILARILTAMVYEGAHVLHDGIAQRASDIDVVYANGYGFPRHRGGPMFWAEQEGTQRILDRIETYRSEFGEMWAPAPTLVSAAAQGSWDG